MCWVPGDGHLDFGLIAARERVANAWNMIDYLREALAELRDWPRNGPCDATGKHRGDDARAESDERRRGMDQASHNQATTAVIPAAEPDTRFLPATKAIPAEMLPVVDKPAIQYMVEEAAASGLTDVLVITSRNKEPLEDHFDRVPELEQALAAKGDTRHLAAVRASSALATVHYVRHGRAKGLGPALACAAAHVGDRPFAVLLSDELIDPRDALLERMLAVRAQRGGSVVALAEVDPACPGRYSWAVAEPTAQAEVVAVTDLMAKPEAGTASSRLAVLGRYVLDPVVFTVLDWLPPGQGSEVQLTDALHRLVAAADGVGPPVWGVVFAGRWYGIRDRAEYLRTIVRLACEREDLGSQFRTWLRRFVTHEMQP
jgi:UTP--glucose-1-phosphate uridylyltransferase